MNFDGHTPGPWKLSRSIGTKLMIRASEKLGGGGAIGNIEAEWDVALIDMRAGTPNGGASQANKNARLIALAPLIPELVQALERTIECMESYRTTKAGAHEMYIEQARAVLAKLSEGGYGK